MTASAFAVVTLLGGGESGALPRGAGLARGGPGGDHVEQPVCLFRGHAGLNQSLPCRGHQFGGSQGGQPRVYRDAGHRVADRHRASGSSARAVRRDLGHNVGRPKALEPPCPARRG
jgi:hypothetical protein